MKISVKFINCTWTYFYGCISSYARKVYKTSAYFCNYDEYIL